MSNMCKIREMNLETAKYYGYEAQSNQLVEECAELIQAVNKYRRVETGLGQPVAEDKKAIARDNLVEGDRRCRVNAGAGKVSPPDPRG